MTIFDPDKQYEQLIREPFEQIARTPGVWYLATPYSRYPRGMQKAWTDAVALTASLHVAGIMVYSPIVHSHPVAKCVKVDTEFENWLKLNNMMMDICCGAIVAEMEGWDNSRGMAYEMNYMGDRGKPIVRWPMPPHYYDS